MNLLIDCSKKFIYLGLFKDEVLIEKYIETDGKHSTYLISVINEFLLDNRVATKQLEGIYCGIGPGSFTGIRLAISVSKTMAYILQIPVYAVSSLALINCLKSNAIIIDDARSNKYYIRIKNQDSIILDDTIINKDELENYVQQYNYLVYSAIEEHKYSIEPSYLQEIAILTDVFKLTASYIKEL